MHLEGWHPSDPKWIYLHHYILNPNPKNLQASI